LTPVLALMFAGGMADSQPEKIASWSSAFKSSIPPITCPRHPSRQKHTENRTRARKTTGKAHGTEIAEKNTRGTHLALVVARHTGHHALELIAHGLGGNAGGGRLEVLLGEGAAG
jgi:hypothetical protein